MSEIIKDDNRIHTYEILLREYLNLAINALNSSIARYGRLTDKASAILTAMSIAISLFGIIAAFVIQDIGNSHSWWRFLLLTEIFVGMLVSIISFIRAMKCLDNRDLMDLRIDKESFDIFTSTDVLRAYYGTIERLFESIKNNKEINNEKEQDARTALNYTKWTFGFSIFLILSWFSTKL